MYEKIFKCAIRSCSHITSSGRRGEGVAEKVTSDDREGLGGLEL